MADKEIVEKLLDEMAEYFDKSETSITYKILYSLAQELDDFTEQKTNLVSEIQIDTASGDFLDDLARLFRLSRKGAETDTELRSRIKSYWPGFSGGGTADAIKSTINKISGIDEDTITITDIVACKILIEVVFGSTEEIALKSTIADTLEQIKAAGVYPFFKWVINGDLLSESLSISEVVSISLGNLNIWIYEQSLVDAYDEVLW